MVIIADRCDCGHLSNVDMVSMRAMSFQRIKDVCGSNVAKMYKHASIHLSTWMCCTHKCCLLSTCESKLVVFVPVLFGAEGEWGGDDVLPRLHSLLLKAVELQ